MIENYHSELERRELRVFSIGHGIYQLEAALELLDWSESAERGGFPSVHSRAVPGWIIRASVGSDGKPSLFVMTEAKALDLITYAFAETCDQRGKGLAAEMRRRMQCDPGQSDADAH